MTPPAVRSRVLALFEAHRRSPGTPFNPGHFLDFLLDDPEDVGDFRNSFAGLRRFNAFIDAVQLEFSVCLSIKDREANPSVDGFVQRVEALMASPKSSLASLRHTIDRGFGSMALVVANVVLLPIVALAHRHPLALALAIALVLAVNGGFAWLVLRFRRYNARLLRQLQALP
jgi:hypothetical protein